MTTKTALHLEDKLLVHWLESRGWRYVNGMWRKGQSLRVKLPEAIEYQMESDTKKEWY